MRKNTWLEQPLALGEVTIPNGTTSNLSAPVFESESKDLSNLLLIMQMQNISNPNIRQDFLNHISNLNAVNLDADEHRTKMKSADYAKKKKS